MNDQVLGYRVTTSVESLVDFMEETMARYTTLEQAIAPIDDRISDLQKDYEPRPLAFWSEILRKFIPVVRAASTDCLNQFDKARSQTTPVPLIVSATSIAYTCDLHSLEEKIEEVGILLTTHLCTVESQQSVETRIRERQHLLHALQSLSKTVHETVDSAKLKIEAAPAEYRKLFKKQPKKSAGPHLRIVGGSNE